jgi:hypothetical protein
MFARHLGFLERQCQHLASCELTVEPAEFQLAWPTQSPRLKWVIKGDASATEVSAKAICSASFERFYGRLTSLQ